MPEKILIVDDSENIREILRELLVHHGYEVLEARDGEEALKRAFDETPDLILLDIIMPGIDGYEVLRRLKQDERSASTPVIFLSALTDAAKKIKGLTMGGVDYVTKPYNMGEVIARVKNQLKIRTLTKRLTEANEKLLKANKELLRRQESLEEDLMAAAGIQRSLLPSAGPGIETLEVSWRFEPCERVGGDIFNMHLLDEENLAIYILDVSGHGVPSAMVTVSVSQVLSPLSGYVVQKEPRERPPGAAVSSVEVLKRLAREYPLRRFGKTFTICYLVLNTKTGLLNYSNAAHPMPVVVRADGSLEILEEGGTIIGLYDIAPHKYEEAETRLYRGDRLFLYTDGIVEHTDPAGRYFGTERLYQKLVSQRASPLSAALDSLMEEVLSFGGEEMPQDDVTRLGIEFKGPPAG